MRDCGEDQHHDDEKVTGGEGADGTGAQAAVSGGGDEENDSRDEGHVVEEIEGASDDGTGHVAGGEKSGGEGDGGKDEGEKDDSADPDDEGEKHQEF